MDNRPGGDETGWNPADARQAQPRALRSPERGGAIRSASQWCEQPEEADVRYALTREWPPRWNGDRGRVDEALLQDVAWPAERGSRTFVCGPSGFVETVANGLVAVGYPLDRVKTERFG